MTIPIQRHAGSRAWPKAMTPAILFLASLLLQPACDGESAPSWSGPGRSAQAWPSPVKPKPEPVPPTVTCPVYADTPSPFPAGELASPFETAEAGTIPGAFSVSPTGEASYSMPLVVPPGRAGMEPRLAISYNSAGGDGVLGMGFALTGLSVITRCPANVAQDGYIRGVRYDEDDALCLDGKRLVPVGTTPDGTEFRTFPETFAKVMGHLGSANKGWISFDVYTRSGLLLRYGTTGDSRVRGKGVTRAWWVAKSSDRRGNFISYHYRNDLDADGHTREHVPDEIRYTGFDGSPALAPERVVRFHYDESVAPPRTAFTGGMAVESTLRLSWVEMRGPGDEPVRSYRFGYEQSVTTGRMLLTHARECAAGDCKPPTRFSYDNAPPSFSSLALQIAAPYAKRSSPMLLDVNGDGINDLVIPDLVDPADPFSSAYIGANGVVSTFWNVALGEGDPPHDIYDSDSFSSFRHTDSIVASLPPDNVDVQPELGTAIDYNQDGRADILLHDVYAQDATWRVLLSKAGGGFSYHDTGVKRPLPAGRGMPDLRTKDGSVHLADVDGDGVPDLVQCENKTPTAPGANDYQWSLHRWKPQGPGFTHAGTPIDALYRYPCNTEVTPADIDGDGKVDLLVAGSHRVGDKLVLHATYDALSWEHSGTWSAISTGLPVSGYGRLILLDVNGDGLVDAIETNQAHQLDTYINTGAGFAPPTPSLPPYVGHPSLALASPIDFDGDGRRDLLVPMPAGVLPGNSTFKPSWAILRSTGSVAGPTFTIVDPQIPYEALLQESGVRLADSRGPRVADIDGDGAEDVLIALSGKLRVFRNNAVTPDLLTAVSDGLNAHDIGETGHKPNVLIRYDHLVDRAITGGLPEGSPLRETLVYLKSNDPLNGCDYPRHCAVGPRRVVRSYALNNGADKQRTFTVNYRDGRYHRLGRGFLGFGSRITTDVATRAVREEVFDNVHYNKDLRAFPYAGQLVHERRWVQARRGDDRIELAFNDVEWTTVPTSGGATYFTLPTRRRTRQAQGSYLPPPSPTKPTLAEYVHTVAAKGGATMIADSTTFVADYDGFGNVLAEETTIGGADAKVTAARAYDNDTGDWKIGLLKSELECSSGAGLTQCRKTERLYDAFGAVRREAKSTADGSHETKLDLSLVRDAFGNVSRVTTVDGLGNHRVACTSYEPEGIFPFAAKNGAGHVTFTRFHRGLGVVTDVVDPNKLVTRWAHDAFGRVTEERRPDNIATTFELRRDKAPTWRTSLRTWTAGGADETVEYDSRGRAIRRLWVGPKPYNGVQPPRLMQRIVYDGLGEHVVRRSLPAKEDTPDNALFDDVYEHDNAGRVVLHTAPWGAETEYDYVGAAVQITEPGKPPRVVHRDGLGRVVLAVDAAGGETSYTYGPFGHLRSVTAPDDTVTMMTRDAWGRVTALEDPDRGARASHYNGYGDLVSTTDALGRVVDITVDVLGRRVARVDHGGPESSVTTWKWDTAPLGAGSAKALGLLAVVESEDGRTSHTYDALAREETTTLTIGDSSFASRLFYGSSGLVEAIAYPSSLGKPFVVGQEHDEHGHLVRVYDATTEDDYWSLTGVDSAGRARKENFGNGVVTTRAYDFARDRVKSIFTAHGWATIQDLSYTYDDRLNVTSRRDGLQAQHKTERFRYDALDRLRCAYFSEFASTTMPCAESFGYDAIGNLTSKTGVGAYVYGDADHPHAVTDAGAAHFTYDGAGNQIERPGATVTYTPFDLPRTLTLADGSVSFGYDGDERRIRKTVSGGDETLYFGGLYERVTHADGSREHRYQVHAGGRLVAIVKRASEAEERLYVHADHLGSVHVLTGADAKVKERRSYDAFGARRNAAWGDSSPPAAPLVPYGYTGHEGDDEAGLVNMKGRVYDPRIGRFMTPDPLVSQPHSGQSWNPYSYVHNNPLAFVDPSGFQEALSEAEQNLIASGSGGAVLRDGDLVGFVDPEVVIVGPPPTPTPEPTPDVSQSIAAGAGHVPNDTGTMGNTSNGVPQPAGVVASGICSSAGPGGCYHDQDAGEWFLEHGQTLQNASIAVAVVGAVFALGAPAALAGSAAKGGALAQAALWSRAGPALMALMAANGGAQALVNAMNQVASRAQDARYVLQRLTDTAVAQLINNPARAVQVLKPAQQALAANPKLSQAMFGKAVEKLVALEVQQKYSHILVHTGNRAGPDFVGIGSASGRIFDITTYFGQASHMARVYGAQLELLLYDAPKNWP